MRTSVALCGFIGLALNCRSPVKESTPENVGRKVNCQIGISKSTRDSIEIRGTVAPPVDRDVQLSSQVAGRITQVDVKEGDPVTLGQVVARVEAAPLADLVAQSQAMIERSAAETQNSETVLSRARQTFERGIAARQEVDDAIARLATSKASQVEAKTSAALAQRQLSRAQIRSPIKGVVIKIWRRLGELVDGTSSTPIVEIADVDSLELLADVPAQDLLGLQKDAAAQTQFSALASQTFLGRVKQISPAVDKTSGLGWVRVTIQIGDETKVPVGLFGKSRVEKGPTRDALFVPSAALRNAIGDAAEVVVCSPDGRALVKPVIVGAAQADVIEIVKGLSADEHVVTDFPLGLSDHDLLEVTR
jgi:RND family efflux transporter MFP subunit